jgi:hypothetical protein
MLKEGNDVFYIYSKSLLSKLKDQKYEFFLGGYDGVSDEKILCELSKLRVGFCDIRGNLINRFLNSDHHSLGSGLFNEGFLRKKVAGDYAESWVAFSQYPLFENKSLVQFLNSDGSEEDTYRKVLCSPRELQLYMAKIFGESIECDPKLSTLFNKWNSAKVKLHLAIGDAVLKSRGEFLEKMIYLQKCRERIVQLEFIVEKRVVRQSESSERVDPKEQIEIGRE